MRRIQALEQSAVRIGLGVGVALLAAPGSVEADALSDRLTGFGSHVERFDETYEALGAVIDDPAGYGLLVIDCDALGGVGGGTRAFHLLGAVRERLPVILIGADCGADHLPETRDAPIVLRGPLTAASLRQGVEHALRHRILWAAA